MSKHGSLCRYRPPEVVDYGNLVEMTAAAHLVLGATNVTDLSFSSPGPTPGPGGGGNPDSPGE
ncbi:MAG: hypothetical protein QOH76_2010, partial [Thermoleophilaceae bacterium]|nr:hypothetical protein [Thermoleophilaceae bacterium]